MVLNMADFGKCRKSLQTPWNASYSVDFGWIRKGTNLADFEQKAWAIAHAFEHGGFW